MITVHPGEIPAEGLAVRGTESRDIFQLPPSDTARSTGPVVYDLVVTPSGNGVLISGKVEASFELECVGCLDNFPLTVRLDPYDALLEFDKMPASIDLTEQLREDILLGLPNYPRCSQGDLLDRVCPMGNHLRFESPGSAEEEASPSDKASGPNVWDALDSLEKPE